MKNLYGQPDPSMIDPAIMDSGGPDPGGIMDNIFQPQSDDAGNVSVSPMSRPGGVNPAIAQDPTSYDAGQRMRDLYKPETASTDKFNALVNQYPNREDYHPSMLRKIGGALTAVGSSFGGPANHRFQFNPEGIQTGMSAVDKPFTDKLTDWKNQIGPAQTAANMERQSNVNERTLAYQTVAQELRQHAQDAKDKNDTKKMAISENRAKVYEFKAHNPGAKFDFSGPTVMVMDPITKKVTDTGIDTGHMSKLDQMNLAQDFTRENIGSRGAEAANVAGIKGNLANETRGWTTTNIPDPNDPSKQIGVRINQITGEVKPITLDNTNVGPLSKTPTKEEQVTNQTKTMMEGSKMLLPHVGELKQQATNLEKLGMFGPVMSRIRNLAAKIGTTGTPEEVQSNLEKFSEAISADPQLNNDAAVGQFATSLGLMTSGMGRVHGGARGGGSIQMINYLKSLTQSESSLPMFLGRLSSIESYLKGYAAGPKDSGVNSKLDKALDEIFGAKK